jgi:hypothetical protein
VSWFFVNKYQKLSDEFRKKFEHKLVRK